MKKLLFSSLILFVIIIPGCITDSTNKIPETTTTVTTIFPSSTTTTTPVISPATTIITTSTTTTVPRTKLQEDLDVCLHLSKKVVCDAFDLSYCGYDRRTELRAFNYPMVGTEGFVPKGIYCHGGSAIGEQSDSLYCGISSGCEQIVDEGNIIKEWEATFIGAEYGAKYEKIDGKNVYTYSLKRCTKEFTLTFNSQYQCQSYGYGLDKELMI
jgi:hypothetical protein